MCTVLLPPGVKPIAVKYIYISYHIISYHINASAFLPFDSIILIWTAPYSTPKLPAFRGINPIQLSIAKRTTEAPNSKLHPILDIITIYDYSDTHEGNNDKYL
jgi:hypothetical protein